MSKRETKTESLLILVLNFVVSVFNLQSNKWSWYWSWSCMVQALNKGAVFENIKARFGYMKRCFCKKSIALSYDEKYPFKVWRLSLINYEPTRAFIAAASQEMYFQYFLDNSSQNEYFYKLFVAYEITFIWLIVLFFFSPMEFKKRT